MDTFLWWRDGIIYQIYPRSFMDNNHDGLGDLPGVISKLEYLQNLGIDAIWLSPFYPSPDNDFGYDVSDHCNVDPRFGTLVDFDALVKKAHHVGLRIIVDLVLNHTSDQHPWFLESRSDTKNPKRGWYLWRPPKSNALGFINGKEPNNWQACFGGKAWEFDPVTGEYYLHLFTPQQPDVNWRNPEVRKAQLDVVNFWLKRGVDGFRLDVFNAYFKDSNLRGNPGKLGLRGFSRQHHIHDMDQPEMIPLLGDLRAIVDSYRDRYAVGETYLSNPEKSISYCGKGKLHQAFSFDFTSYSSEIGTALGLYIWNPRWILGRIIKREKLFNTMDVFPTTVLSNHDIPRATSRYIRGEDDRKAKILNTILLTLRGTPYMYQGEEIGMRDIGLKYQEVLDPPGKKYWPFYFGRDGCRSPMQWDSSSHAGFSTVKPWLKIHKNYMHRNVAAQEKDPTSLLNYTKKLISLRKNHPALHRGDFIPVEASRWVLAYYRKHKEQIILVVMNFKARKSIFTLPASIELRNLLLSSVNKTDPYNSRSIHLSPYEACLWLVAERKLDVV